VLPGDVFRLLVVGQQLVDECLLNGHRFPILLFRWPFTQFLNVRAVVHFEDPDLIVLADDEVMLGIDLDRVLGREERGCPSPCTLIGVDFLSGLNYGSKCDLRGHFPPAVSPFQALFLLKLGAGPVYITFHYSCNKNEAILLREFY